MNLKRLNIGIKAKTLVGFIFIFVTIIGFNAYIGISSLNSAKNASKNIGDTILLEQSKTYYENYTTSQIKTLQLLLTNIENDVSNLKDFTTRLYSSEQLFNTNGYWNHQEHLERLPNNQLIEISTDKSTLWSPSWMDVNENVLNKIETSAFLNEYFEPLLLRNKNTVANYFIGTEGFLRYFPKIEMLTFFATDYNLTQKLFFQPATPRVNPQRKLVWTPLYQDPAGQGWMISVIAPIYVKDEFWGVVGTDITLNKLTTHHMTQNKEKGSYSILLDKKFRPIAMPKMAMQAFYGKHIDNVDNIISTSLLDYESPFKDVFNKIKNDHSGFEKVVVEEKNLYVSFVKLPKLDWVYINILSESEILSATKTLASEIDAITERLINKLTVPAILFFMISILLISLIINRFLQPIIALSNVTRVIASGQIDQTDQTDQTIKIYAKNEVGILVDNFKIMQTSISQQKTKLEKFNVELQKKITERTAELASLREISKELSVNGHPTTIFNCAYKHMSTIVDTNVFIITGYEKDKSAVHFRLSTAIEETPITSIQISDTAYLANLCISQDREIVIRQASEIAKHLTTDKRKAADEIIQSMLFLPLRSHGRKVNTCMILQSKKTNAYSDDKIEIIATLASYTALALDNASAYLQVEKKNTELSEALKYLEESDQLTGAHNRRFLQKFLSLEFDNVKPNTKTKFGFIVVDPDHFKQVNEVHGHKAGDTVLKQFIQIIKKACQPSDWVIRLGSEEFLVVSRAAHISDITQLSEKIRTDIDKHVFDIADGITLRKTCSIGAVSYPFYENDIDKFSWEQVITLANVALYTAKNNNRNAWIYLYPNNSQQIIDYQELTTNVSTYIDNGLLKCKTSLAQVDFVSTKNSWPPSKKCLKPAALIESLTKRELEVLTLISKGYSNNDICEELFLALDTIKGCNRRIYNKLGVNKRIEAVLIAQQLDLI
jgi:diguanylate cyclase (GGDEF)-like protein